ncbi:carboxypeptidase regulatory-like domain-containing protein [Archangium lansingense]|uniref:Carboxypeptidase regulatory-like domain-containing protein n=1 Tax=Archangium lansingense TaxID=2995310 RepID=A0ABT4A1Q8_9BACT|nr:carboxypeptidase regulatory-like domain-containing protein [Archangium lansinium]MCY1075565.1 carboxypeptidase regulatory-like domain-containing protein [Archangium lansinium]
MPFRPRPFFAVLLLALTLGAPISAWAQGVPAEQASVRVRYGLAFRQGAQEVGPTVSYGGMTPNDVALWAAVFGEGWLGAWASVQREGFSLSQEAQLVTGGSLLRASVGPAARVFLGPVRAEVSAGYGFAQLPVFSNEGQVRLVPTARHAALVGARVLVPLPWSLRAEVRGELPVAIGSTSEGFAAGGALLIPVLRRGEWGGALALEYQYLRDSLTTADGAVSRQVISRAGVAFELSYGGGAREARVEEAAQPETGELVLSVVDAESGRPLPDARVVLTVGGMEQEPRVAGADGRLTGVVLPRGEVLARVSAGGYVSAEERVTVPAGGRAERVVRVRQEPPRVGSLRITVVDARSGGPLAGAAVSVGSTQVFTDATGRVRVEGLAPGPVEVNVSAEGFRAAQEAVVIVVGTRTELPVTLVSASKGALATLSGQVRGVRKGKPLRAWLVIPEAKLRRRTDVRGSFQVQLKQGRYRLIFSAPGHLSQTKVVTVREGEQAIFNVDLFPKSR